MGSNLDPNRLRSQVHNQNDNSSVIGIAPVRVRTLVYNLQETLLIACQAGLAKEILADSDDARNGKERKLSSTYRLLCLPPSVPPRGRP